MGLAAGVVTMAALAFALRQDGLLPSDWTPRPRSVEEGADDEEEILAEEVEVEPPIVEAPRRQSATPARRVHGPPALAEVQPAGDSAHGEIHGEVRDHVTSALIADATLTFRHEDEDFEIRSDGEGRFRFTAPREGVFVLDRAEAQGYFPLTSALDERMTFHTSTAHTLGAVVLRLHAVAPLRVFVHGANAALVSGSVRSVGERASFATYGRYEVPNGDALVPAPEGSTLEATTREPPALGHALVSASSTLTGVLHVHTRPLVPNDQPLRGQVLSLQGSEPLSGAHIDVVSEEGIRVARIVTGDSGRFAYHGPAPGPFSLTARADGYAAESRAQATRAGETVLLLSEEAGVEGRVVDADGAPVPSFAVFVEAHTSTLERRLSARSDTFDVGGAFRIGGLSSGGYTVSVAADGFAPITREVRLSRGDVARPEDFRLRRGGVLEGVVRGDNGLPLANVHIRAESAIEGTGLPLSAEVRSDDEGLFRVEGLSQGEVKLTFAVARHETRIVRAETGSAPADITLNEVADNDEPIEVLGHPPE